VAGLRGWGKRGVRAVGGDVEMGTLSEEEREGCIRCEAGSDGEGTMGFFVVGFVRDADDTTAVGANARVRGDGPVPKKTAPRLHVAEAPAAEVEEEDEEEEEEWNGFSDE